MENLSARSLRSGLLGTIGIALAYFLTGRLSMELNVPPGFATAVWPPAGIALTALLLLGKRFMGGVFLGSSLVVLSRAQEPLDASFLTLLFCIAFGATLQAVLSAQILRRFISLPTGLERHREVLALILIGGPIGCLISATIACSAMLSLGLISHEEWLTQWLSWWIGDALGVMTVTPALLLLFAGRELVSLRRRLVVCGTLVVIFSASAYTFRTLEAYAANAERLKFEVAARVLAESIKREMRNSFVTLTSIRSLINASEDVTDREFNTFTAPFFSQSSSIASLSWNPRVTDAQRLRFEQEMRVQGYHDYEIREWGEEGVPERAAQRSEYFPSKYIVPYEPNKQAHGMDINSSTSRLELASEARVKGEARVLAPLTLNEDMETTGLLIFLPVYDTGEGPRMDAGPQFRGYVSGIFRIDDLFADVTREGMAQHLRIVLRVDSSQYPSRTIYETPGTKTYNGPLSDQRAEPQKKWVQEFTLAGNHWTIEFYEDSPPDMWSSGWLRWGALCAIVLFAGLMGTLLLIITGQTDEVRRLVRVKTEALAESEARLKTIIENAVDGLLIFDDSGTIEMLNPACEEVFGYAAQDVVGQNVNLLIPAFSIRMQDIESLVHKPGAGAAERGLTELLGRRRNEEVFPVELLLSAIHFSGRRLFIGIIRDITERKQSEQTREKLIEELVGLNEELEQFAYIATHDLREPLRRILNFTDLIQKDCGDELSDTGREYLQLCRESARRLVELVGELLEYARLNRDSERNTKIDAEEEVRHVLRTLAAEIAESKAEVRVGQLPSFMGNAVRFGSLMYNLIGNALKYRNPGVAPKIEVKAEERPEYWLFSVRDNGIGIKDAYLDQIFLPFKRLHTEETYSGTGIGLAICRRIVENFGGRIWAESAPKFGTVIYFTLPKSLT